MVGLYIHIPFCNKICTYCDFARIENDTLIQDQYINNLLIELDNWKDYHFETIYIGGGTPTVLTYPNWEKLFLKLKNWRPSEFTIEANPESLNLELLSFLKNHQVNRLSIGAQSTNNILLKTLNRDHSKQTIIDSIKKARKVGFKNISLDFIYGFKQQTLKDLKTDLKFIKKYKLNHLSFYELIIKERSKLKDEDLLAREKLDVMWEIIEKKMKKNNYQHYEISNFTKNNNFKSKHNLIYWNSNEWIACGWKAYSFFKVDNNYFYTRNKGKLLDYKMVKKIVPPNDLYQQVIMMALRLKNQGLNLNDNLHLETYYFFKNKIDLLINEKILIKEDNYIYVAKNWYSLLDSVLLKII